VARRLDARAPDFAARLRGLAAERRVGAADVGPHVAAIIAEVRQGGDQGLIDCTRRFDGIELDARALKVGDQEIEQAESAVDGETLAALKFAAERIGAFHLRQKPKDDMFTDGAGVRLGQRWTPIDAVGIYVPGGKAAYPSSVLMNAIPAAIAGVKRIVMTTPGKTIHPLVLTAARLAGVHEIYRVGGAQAVAALAFGTASLRAVDKIVGPGNAYVAEAKRQVFGAVGIDTIAGPSEILVVADGENDPAWIAADLLSQAEHDEEAQAVLITDDGAFADKVAAAAEVHLRTLARAGVAGESWRRHGIIIVVARLSDAVAIVDILAPEHVELAVADPAPLAAAIRHAGAIFLGRHTPEAIGDYVAGPNHVLPTAGAARFASGLSVLDFMKRTSIVGCDGAALARLGPAAMRLADAEGLGAHALSVAIRLNRREP
jgi:histidinol dehydrogenase